jgi:dihydroflavonol-4-reductase
VGSVFSDYAPNVIKQARSRTMRALVTGANGHLGYNLCKALIEAGYQVRASIRQAADAAKAGPLQVLGDIELVELDVRDAAAFARAVEGADRLFHAAATFAFYTGSREKDAEMVRDSVEGAENALRAAARAGVKKVGRDVPARLSPYNTDLLAILRSVWGTP